MNDTDIPGVTGETTDATPAAAPETPSGRDKRGRFQKGAPSANPRGRPTESREVKELARALGPAAIARLKQLMYGDDPQVCIAAAKALLDRGYGRPEQAIVAAVATFNPAPDLGISWDDGGPGDNRPLVSDPVEASRIYLQMVKGEIPLGSVRFGHEQQAAIRYAELIGVGLDGSPPSDEAIAKIFDTSQGKPLSPSPPPTRPALVPPESRAEPPEPLQAPTSPEPRPAAQEFIAADEAPPSTMDKKTRELWERLGRPANPAETISAMDEALRYARPPYVVT